MVITHIIALVLVLLVVMADDSMFMVSPEVRTVFVSLAVLCPLARSLSPVDVDVSGLLPLVLYGMVISYEPLPVRRHCVRSMSENNYAKQV